MLFSRLPLSLLTLIFVFAFDTTFAKTDGGDNETMKNGDPVEWVDIFAVDYPIVAYVVDTVCSPSPLQLYTPSSSIPSYNTI